MVRTSRALVFNSEPSSRPQSGPSNLRRAALSPAVLGIVPIPAAAAGTQGEPWLAGAIVLAALILAVPVTLQLRRKRQADRSFQRADDAARQAAERALRESQARYREVVESVNEVIFRTDAEGRFNFLNTAWQSISGYTVAESLGQKLCAYLHPDDIAKVCEQLGEAAAGAQDGCQCEFRLRTRSGEIRWIEATARAVRDGGSAGLAGTLDDISARKIAELTLRNLNQELEFRVRVRTAELENANRELEAFSYSVSHDLRAPLRAIDGFARILEEELESTLTPSARAHLERIRKATERMARLIDDLLNLARLTRQPLTRETVDLSALAAQIIDELRAEQPERQVTVDIQPQMQALADRNLMRIVLDNLLRNAWKFSAWQPQARINFWVEHDRDRKIYCVRDNGAGFDMAYAANLFRPFHRLHSEQDFAGTGIGLATVQRIIARHGGAVWARSRPGEGAQFFFTLDSPEAPGP